MTDEYKSEEDTNNILNIIFDADHYKTKTHISYTKLQDILATIGGIIQFLKVILKFILFHIYKYDFFLRIFSEQYLNGHKFLRIDQNGNYIPESEYKILNNEKDFNTKIKLEYKKNESEKENCT